MRHYAHHIGDYRAATAHLSFVEDAAYRRLLDVYYLNEKPLAIDVGEVQRIAGARSKDERRAVESMLREFFTLEEDGWHQKRADDEIGAYQSRADTARENGRLGGRPKTQRKPSRNPSGSSREPSQKLTKNHEPVTINQDGANAPSPDPRSDDDERIKLPADWRPSLDDRSYASDKGLDPESTAAAFTDWFGEGRGRSEKRTRAGWSKRWRVWCNTDADRRPSGRQGVRPAVGGGETAAFARAAARLGGS